MIIIEKEYNIKDVKREKDSEGKEKYVVLTLDNAPDENLLNSKNIILSKVDSSIRKN